MTPKRTAMRSHEEMRERAAPEQADLAIPLARDVLALLADVERKDRALVTLLEDLRGFVEPCDHVVNICWCGIKADIEHAEAALAPAKDGAT